MDWRDLFGLERGIFELNKRSSIIVCGQFSLQLILTAVSVGGNRSSIDYT